MLKSRSGSSSSSGDKIFSGVRFVLFGFDSVSEAQYRSELVRRGGTDVVTYEPSCTHVFVSRRVYDDPVCVAARQDGKILVTELWIDDSVDFGTLADASRVLYRPVKDLNGIPGSQSLYICLTGYQRQEREDIMKMVSLMGARFSKPLIANHVTHLICYKFEGEKYELAKKVKIKLVNHRWLEDCLHAWEILPIDNYTKSGWELEVLEAEAKDSEEETEDPGMELLRQKSTGVALRLRGEMSVTAHSRVHTPNKGTTSIHQDVSAANLSHTAENLQEKQRFSTPCKESSYYKKIFDCNVDIGHQEDRSIIQTSGYQNHDAVKEGELSVPPDINLQKRGNALSSDILTTKMRSASSRLDERYSFSTKTPTKEVVREEPSTSWRGDLNENNSKGDIDIALLETRRNCKSDIFQSSTTSSALSQKRKVSELSIASKSPKLEGQGSKVSLQSSYTSMGFAQIESTPATPLNHGDTDTSTLFEGAAKTNAKGNQHAASSKFMSLSYMNRSLKRSQPTSEANIFKSLDSPSAGSAQKCQLREALDQPMGIRNKSSVETMATGPANTNVKDNQHAAPSKFMSLSYKKRSLKCSQPTSEVNIFKSLDSPSAGSAQKGQPREVLDQPMGIRNKSSVETKTSGPVISPSDDMVLGDFPPDVEPKKAMDIDRNLEKTASGLDSMVIDDQRKDVNPLNEKMPENVGGLVEPEQAGKYENGGDIVINDAYKFSPNETAQSQGNHQDGGAVSPCSRDSETRKLSSTASTSTCQGNTNKVKSGVRMKKVVSRKNLSSKSKLTRANTTKDKGVNTSDTTTTRKAEVKSAKIEKLNAEKDLEKVVINEKKEVIDNAKEELLQSVLEDAVTEGKVMPKQQPSSEGISKKKFAESSSKRKVVNQMEYSKDSEKENKPKENVIVASNVNSHPNGKVEDSKKSRKGTIKVSVVKNNGDETSGYSRLVNSEPVWFILSGHRFQRKEFQAVIRRLRGRVCRDSHNWSYQATHFIVPDPVRRTEKFFAAAAAGRWILKTDYLTVSNEAGKFLDEEPFEWYRKGLTEDGAINLEAPRKWCHLREKTGHGAFYGMRIIIYGECIAPTLDTLKRVVKAGDGTILATSPPYTRFVKSGVDFAVVSASMPRVDAWVQEFLRHEIPCVVPDYLVEYVCKPGFSLERHVLYNTHSWAERSFADMLSRSEEIVTDDTPPPEESTDDISCSVCRSRDRGEVMLICGDEGGSTGCGIGTHIDCCNPPLDAVPEGDWLCLKCSKGSELKTPLKTNKKKSSSKCK